MRTTWVFIGSGNIGSTVARVAAAAGHDVVMSNSRGPDTLGDGYLNPSTWSVRILGTAPLYTCRGRRLP